MKSPDDKAKQEIFEARIDVIAALTQAGILPVEWIKEMFHVDLDVGDKWIE